MAKLTMEHQEEILTFPNDTILDLKIEECNTETINGRNGDWTKLRFKFKILGIQAIGDGGDPARYENWITREIWGSVPARLSDSPENRLRIWAEAIFKTELGIGFELDTDMFIGRRVRGLTSQYDAKGRDSSGQPFKRHQIETLLPAAGEAMPTQAAPQQGYAQRAPQQGYAQPTPPAPAADPWASTPPAYAGDPWASSGSDEPPF